MVLELKGVRDISSHNVHTFSLHSNANTDPSKNTVSPQDQRSAMEKKRKETGHRWKHLKCKGRGERRKEKEAANQSCTFDKVFEEEARRRSYIKRRGTENCEKEYPVHARLEPVEPAEYSQPFSCF